MQEKEQHIIKETEQLYRKYGIKSVTMDDVAVHLGISKKTLYQIVKDKKELVEKVFIKELEYREKQYLEIFSKNLNAIDELLEVKEFIKELFKEHNPSMNFDLRKYYPELYNKIKDVKRKRMYETSLRNLEKGKRDGLYRKELNAEIIAKLHVFRIENIIDNDLFTPEELVSEAFFNEIFKYHIYGIVNNKGLEYIKNISIK